MTGRVLPDPDIVTTTINGDCHFVDLTFDYILARKAMGKYGLESQMDLVVEELSELIMAIQKWKRYGASDATRFAIATEHADVELMLAQLSYMMTQVHQMTYERDLDYNRVYKRERLAAILGGEL
jgi:hypothetical protein